MSARNLPGGEGRPARKADNLTAICEPTVYKLSDPQHLTTLWVSTARYRESFILSTLLLVNLYAGEIYTGSHFRLYGNLEYKGKIYTLHETHVRVRYALSMQPHWKVQCVQRDCRYSNFGSDHIVTCMSDYRRGLDW
jgi:hypothetical protein